MSRPIIPDPVPEVVTLPELAAWLGKDRSTVWRWSQERTPLGQGIRAAALTSRLYSVELLRQTGLISAKPPRVAVQQVVDSDRREVFHG